MALPAGAGGGGAVRHAARVPHGRRRGGRRRGRPAPRAHYGGIFDQLRLEVLTDGPARLAAGGRLGLATQLEWQAGGRLAVEHLLRPLAERGARVRVAPIASTVKREWFKLARGEDPRLV